MGIPFLVSRSGLTQMGFEIAEKVGHHDDRTRHQQALPALHRRRAFSERAADPGCRRHRHRARRRPGPADGRRRQRAGRPRRAADGRACALAARSAGRRGSGQRQPECSTAIARLGYPVVAGRGRRLRRSACRPARGIDARAPRVRRHRAVRLAVSACRSRRAARRCARAQRRATRGREDLRPAASGVRAGATRRSARSRRRSSKAAAARSTRGMPRSLSWKCSFDDEADAFRNINTADELSAATNKRAGFAHE